MWSWTSHLSSGESQSTCTKLLWYHRNWGGERVLGFVGLSSAHYLHLDRPVITKTLCSFSFLVLSVTEPDVCCHPYCRICIVCTLCSVPCYCSSHSCSIATPLNSLSHFLTFLLINSHSDSPLINLEFKKGRLSPSCMNVEQLHILANAVKYQYPSQLIWKWNGAACIRKIVDTRNW